MKTYLHRVGRTARAGEHGVAYTILRPQEVVVITCLLYVLYVNSVNNKPHVILHHVILPHVILPYVILHHVMLPHVILPHVMLPHVKLPHVILPHVILPHVMLPHVIPCFSGWLSVN